MFRGYQLFKYFFGRETRLWRRKYASLKVGSRGRFISLIFEFLPGIYSYDQFIFIYSLKFRFQFY